MADLRHFIAGFRRFQQLLSGDNERLDANLVKGQNPQMLFICCSDPGGDL